MANNIDRDSFNSYIKTTFGEEFLEDFTLNLHLDTIEFLLKDLTDINMLAKIIETEDQYDPNIVLIGININTDSIDISEVLIIYEATADLIISLLESDIQNDLRFHLVWNAPQITLDRYTKITPELKTQPMDINLRDKFRRISKLTTNIILHNDREFPKLITEVLSPSGQNIAIVINIANSIFGDSSKYPLIFAHIGLSESNARRSRIGSYYNETEFFMDKHITGDAEF